MRSTPILGAASLLLLACCLGLRAQAEAFQPCAHNTADDPGLRVLLEAVYANDANLRMVQRALGRSETPVQGSAAEVDLLAWCRCVHESRVSALGEQLAVDMTSLQPERAARYDAWFRALPPEKQREITVDRWAADATCVDASRK
jgi:hypothetical protein